MSESRGAVAEERPLAFAVPDAGSSSPAPAGADAAARLGTEIESVIGRRLKALYDDVVAEPVPERLLQLLAELEAAGPAAASAEEVPAPPAAPGTGKVDR